MTQATYSFTSEKVPRAFENQKSALNSQKLQPSQGNTTISQQVIREAQSEGADLHHPGLGPVATCGY